MRRANAAFALAAALIIGSGAAPPTTAHAQAVERPWDKAEAAVKATEADLDRSGIQAIGPHVPDLEQALADGDHPFGAEPETGPIHMLADGPAETLALLTAATMGAGGKREVDAADNPYPLVGFYLGSYYNEAGKSAEALRALDAGLALSEGMGLGLGAHRSLLVSERAAALIALKRWPEALAGYDSGLKLGTLRDIDRARMHRGRGFVLTELGRLDEAEAAYRTSLKFEPDSTRAHNELKYIARLKSGGPASPFALGLIPPKPDQ